MHLHRQIEKEASILFNVIMSNGNSLRYIRKIEDQFGKAFAQNVRQKVDHMFDQFLTNY